MASDNIVWGFIIFIEATPPFLFQKRIRPAFLPHSPAGQKLKPCRISKTFSLGFANPFLPQNNFAKPSPHFASPPAENLEAEHRRKIALSFFKKEFPARKSGKQGAFFFGVRRGFARRWRGVHPFCFRSCKIRANDIISS